MRILTADIKDLGENGKDESNSIESQRMLIRNYLTGHSEIVGEVVEYKDDGFTGLNFNRPAFREMIEDAKKGYIGTIVVKDLSRFGRDYIGVGDYLEQILPSLGVRLIAINIVSKSDYETAQLIIQRRGDSSKFKNSNNDLLSGMIRCGCCGHLLQYLGTDNRHLYCQHATDVGSKSNCNREQYDVLNIRSIVLHSLRVHLKLLSDVNDVLTERKRALLPTEQENEGKLRNRLEELNNEFVRQYENYVNGHLDRAGFLNVKECITEEKVRLENQLNDLDKSRDEKDKLLFEMERTLNIGDAVKDCKTIKKTVLIALIEEIRVHNSKKIEIRFKFEDLYQQALEELESAG